MHFHEPRAPAALLRLVCVLHEPRAPAALFGLILQTVMELVHVTFSTGCNAGRGVLWNWGPL